VEAHRRQLHPGVTAQLGRGRRQPPARPAAESAQGPACPMPKRACMLAGHQRQHAAKRNSWFAFGRRRAQWYWKAAPACVFKLRPK